MELVHKVIGTCREMTQLISESQERELHTTEKVQMAMHTGMCPACKNFKKNTHFLRHTMQSFKNYKE